MNWFVTLEFKRGPSFGAVMVTADNVRQAVEKAKTEASGFGFDHPVKKAIVRPE